MTHSKKIYCFFLAILSGTGVFAQDIYKWVDNNGVTHYSQTPPTTKKATILKTYGQTTPNASSTPPEPQAPVIHAPIEKNENYTKDNPPMAMS